MTTLPMEQFKQHIVQIKQQVAEYIGIFLYGSQNYGLDYEGSDVDTIVLIRAADRPKQILTFDFGKAKVYTLKYFLHRLELGDLECYEILYTQYCHINPLYSNAWYNFVNELSNGLCGPRLQYSLKKKLNEHLNHLLWLPTNPDNAYYNKKRLYWAIRVAEQLERMDNETFAASLLYTKCKRQELLNIKKITNYLSPKELNIMFKQLKSILYKDRLYINEITQEEKHSFSIFYNNIISIEAGEIHCKM